jgi:hypothetical protein
MKSFFKYMQFGSVANSGIYQEDNHEELAVDHDFKTGPFVCLSLPNLESSVLA